MFRIRVAVMVVALLAAAAGCSDDTDTDSAPPVTASSTTLPASTTPTTSGIEDLLLRWDFTTDTAGWTVDWADYGTAQEPLDAEAGIRPLPEGLGEEGSGLMVAGANTSDDLFMFLSREVGRESGVEPGVSYRALLRWAVASGAPSECVGIGGAPGESVYMKAGAVATEPAVILDDGDYRLNLDKGNQSSGGADVAVVGDIANGVPCEEALESEPRPFRTLTFDHETRVTADGDGRVWIVVGTDSGFEGTTALYYRWVQVDLIPVSGA